MKKQLMVLILLIALDIRDQVLLFHARVAVDIIKILLPFDAKQQEEVKDKLPIHEQLWRLTENRKNTL
jgi:hypothetical protein